MRLLCEIFVIGGLLYLGWDTSFHARLESATGSARHAAAAPATTTSAATGNVPLQPFVRATPARIVTAPQAQPAASVSGSWMFDPNHRSALDAPRKSSTPH
jgi:hypothetical protein